MLSQAGIKYRRRNSHHESPNSPSRQTLASVPHKYSTVASRGNKIRQPAASGGSTTNPTDDKQLTTSTKLGHVFMQACIFKVGDDVRQVSNYYHGKRINDNRLLLLTNLKSGGFLISTNPIKAPDIHFSFSQFRKQHPSE
ncbi:unnamed protein product [Schistosoma mattheei]|uniref:Uncharacterized protein n=1 Tax=Schistosoma mattheei TaxID=31246 RepID=A0A183Q857_9TREM|nr:unnamed protein product [Schistosoma mattheei]